MFVPEGRLTLARDFNVWCELNLASERYSVSERPVPADGLSSYEPDKRTGRTAARHEHVPNGTLRPHRRLFPARRAARSLPTGPPVGPQPQRGDLFSPLWPLGLFRQRTGLLALRPSPSLRPYFPGLGHRSGFNRLERAYGPALQRVATGLAQQLGARRARYEALDLTAAPTRNAQRRGRGWLAGQADIGFSNRLGWFAGFKVLASCTPRGVITGFGVAPASSKDQPFAETFLALRYHAAGRARLPAVGLPARGGYVLDKGFAGAPRHRAWQQAWGVAVLCAPPAYRGAKHPWPKAARRQVAHLRQIIETVFGKVLISFGLERERPHGLEGFLARLAARVGLHNFCIWLNRQLGRADLAFADLVDCWAN